VKILFITATRIGDAVISTGLLDELARRHPAASITVACGPLAASLFAAVPGVVRVIPLAKRRFAWHWVQLWRDVRAESWDLVVDLRRSLLSRVLRAGERLVLPPTDHSRHRVDFLPTILGRDGGLDPVVHIPGGVEGAVAQRFGHGPLIAIAPIAARPEKTWPMDRFVSLARALLAGPCVGNRLAIIAGPGETWAADAFADLDPMPMIGEPDLLVVAGLLRRSRLFVGNDSGLSHLAAAVGAPTLTLFGPTEPVNYAPRGPRVSVLRAPGRDGCRPIDGIEVSSAVDAARALLH
jgi:ADP-heptose:LPS heptosyltransferase